MTRRLRAARTIKTPHRFTQAPAASIIVVIGIWLRPSPPRFAHYSPHFALPAPRVGPVSGRAFVCGVQSVCAATRGPPLCVRTCSGRLGHLHLNIVRVQLKRTARNSPRPLPAALPPQFPATGGVAGCRGRRGGEGTRCGLPPARSGPVQVGGYAAPYARCGDSQCRLSSIGRWVGSRGTPPGRETGRRRRRHRRHQADVTVRAPAGRVTSDPGGRSQLPTLSISHIRATAGRIHERRAPARFSAAAPPPQCVFLDLGLRSNGRN